jgi:hypothetical protein
VIAHISISCTFSPSVCVFRVIETERRTNICMHSHYNREDIDSGSSLIDMQAKQSTDPLFLDKREIPMETSSQSLDTSGKLDTPPPISDQQGASPDEQDRPMIYHIICIIRCTWKWYKNLSLLSRIVLALLVLYILSLLVNVLVQILLQSMGLIYTILGILASAIVIYEFFFMKKQRL